jgi:hypothetical protein
MIIVSLFDSKGVGGTLACGRGGGRRSNSDEGTETLVLYEYYNPSTTIKAKPYQKNAKQRSCADVNYPYKRKVRKSSQRRYKKSSLPHYTKILSYRWLPYAEEQLDWLRLVLHWPFQFVVVEE